MIKVLQADITTLAVDAIVNAANALVLSGGGCRTIAFPAFRQASTAVRWRTLRKSPSAVRRSKRK